MKFRIIATVIFLGVLAVCYVFFEENSGEVSKSNSPAQTQQITPAKKSPFVTN